jgi:Zn ribbon nucleic-acid-binding protein
MPVSMSPSLRKSFQDVALVHCPSCSAQATVRHQHGALRLTCVHCGFSQTATSGDCGRLSFESYEAGRPPFDARLWLEAECCRERLWALNERHLAYIADYVAELQRNREFPSPSGNRQLAYKFPKWMKLAKNRDEILRVVERLGAKT